MVNMIVKWLKIIQNRNNCKNKQSKKQKNQIKKLKYKLRGYYILLKPTILVNKNN